MNSSDSAFSFDDIPPKLYLKDTALLNVIYQNGAMNVAEMCKVLEADNIAIRNSLYRLMRIECIDKVETKKSLRYNISELVIKYFIWQEGVNGKNVDFHSD